MTECKPLSCGWFIHVCICMNADGSHHDSILDAVRLFLDGCFMRHVSLKQSAGSIHQAVTGQRHSRISELTGHLVSLQRGNLDSQVAF